MGGLNSSSVICFHRAGYGRNLGKLIDYDQSKEVNRNIPIYIKLFLRAMFH